YSGGNASGMVAKSWATFMIGPLRPPSAAASSIAFLPRSSASPNSRAPAMRAATPLILAPTRSSRAARAEEGMASRAVVGLLARTSTGSMAPVETHGARGCYLPDSCEILSSIHRATSSILPDASAEDHSGGGGARHVKIDPVETEKHNDRCDRLSRPLEEVFGRFHQRIIQDRALPLGCLWPHSDVIAASKQFADRVKAERTVHFELLLGEQLIRRRFVRITRKAALVIDDIIVFIARDRRFHIEQYALSVLWI